MVINVIFVTIWFIHFGVFELVRSKINIGLDIFKANTLYYGWKTKRQCLRPRQLRSWSCIFTCMNCNICN